MGKKRVSTTLSYHDINVALQIMILSPVSIDRPRSGAGIFCDDAFRKGRGSGKFRITRAVYLASRQRTQILSQAENPP
jgi:hypothetical protein